MFSGNQKISSRQLYRNYTAGFISLSALLPPLIINGSNIVSILLAVIFLGIFLAGSAVIPRPVSTAVKALCYVHYWILGTMLVRMTGLLVQEFLLTDTKLWIIAGWFYVICYYNLYKGLECRLRVSEVLFPFFTVLLIFLSILMYGEVQIHRLEELEYIWNMGQVQKGYELFCWLGAIQSLWHLNGQLQDEHKWRTGVWKIWLSGAVITILWSLFTYCIYGNAGHTGLMFPLANAMTLAHFPGNVIGRMDTLFVFAWMIGLFLLCSSLFAPLVDGEPDKQRKYLLFALLSASYAAVLLPECMEWGQKLLYYVSTPAQLLLLFFYAVTGNGKKKVAVCVLPFVFLFLTGCSAQELEQRSLVTAVGVDAGEESPFLLTFQFGTSAKEEPKEPFVTEAKSLREAEELYWKTSWKHMDFNHLKNIYFSQEILDTEDMENLLEEIQIDGAYSRGTLVHITEEEAAREAEKEEQPKDGTPMHRLLNEWYNNGRSWK